ncbi:hypothetical protein CEXT_45041 [Caerostris extrusa]|uniref:Uncharacterized protein n=1 Tax=Caerostris extrusa TaxID=172846 RepID=A0AAV4URY6_CAEEX|nr:hypothetical protein CEXT_45041 [Caerostris extrusa]
MNPTFPNIRRTTLSNNSSQKRVAFSKTADCLRQVPTQHFFSPHHESFYFSIFLFILFRFLRIPCGSLNQHKLHTPATLSNDMFAIGGGRLPTKEQVQ